MAAIAAVRWACLRNGSPAVAGFEYVTHWNTYNPSVGGTAFNGLMDVTQLTSTGDLVIVDSNAGWSVQAQRCPAGGRDLCRTFC